MSSSGNGGAQGKALQMGVVGHSLASPALVAPGSRGVGELGVLGERKPRKAGFLDFCSLIRPTHERISDDVR